MKILYAVQGTGNGHLSRAREIIPALQKRAEVEVLVSGTQADISLPVPPKYQYHGISFIFGQKGGIDFAATWRRNYLQQIMKEVNSLPVQEYDLVISDFEPISCWASQLKGKTCIGLSNQATILLPGTPRPKHRDPVGEMVLRYYAPTAAAYGFHFQAYQPNIFTPVIRQEVRQLQPSDEGYYTVYLPAHSDELILKVLSAIPDIPWQVFSKHSKKPYRCGNVNIQPIKERAFLESMEGCSGILCAAGFATPAEALFLKKKLMVVPMKYQYEQQCNAAALKAMGVAVLKSFKKKQLPRILDWLEKGSPIPVLYPDRTQEMVDAILAKHAVASTSEALPSKVHSIVPEGLVRLLQKPGEHYEYQAKNR
ncbi:glycosyltransferase family protein [Cesiribacter sp. SM1]|uniref:glycosyltransferase family protein n=1 Tax=Cesiribacter sp. SM1 TaxID=2861196 RepID=UPI001CD5C493|nr:glycosyltransferase family protein [Cesiribacter sp. SM1]